jgi:hypothetical protein
VLDGVAASQVDGQRVDLDDVAGPLEGDVFRLADGVWPGLLSRCARDLADEVRDRRNPAAHDQAFQDATDRCFGHGKADLAQDRPELVPAPERAPERKVEPEPLDLGTQFGRPGPLAQAMRSMAPRRGRLLPAVERRTRHADGMGGLTGIQPIVHRAPPRRVFLPLR